MAVTGGRPGVGATTAAINLAAALADAGQRVVLVDAALAEANLPRLAGLDRHANPHALREVLAGNRSALAAMQPGPAGALILADDSPLDRSPDDSRRTLQRLISELRKLAEVADLVVVDTGSGITPWTRRLWQRACQVLVVTTSDDIALRDSYATIKLAAHRQLAAPIRLLINRCERPLDADLAHRRLASACRQHLGRDVHALPYLPLYHDERGDIKTWPRVWERPNSPFGHAALWLGRAVRDALASAAPAAIENGCPVR